MGEKWVLWHFKQAFSLLRWRLEFLCRRSWFPTWLDLEVAEPLIKHIWVWLMTLNVGFTAFGVIDGLGREEREIWTKKSASQLHNTSCSGIPHPSLSHGLKHLILWPQRHPFPGNGSLVYFVVAVNVWLKQGGATPHVVYACTSLSVLECSFWSVNLSNYSENINIYFYWASLLS